MKTIKTILLSSFLILSSIVFAQDLKLKMPTASIECKTFNWKNGEGTYVPVKFEYFIEEENKLSDDGFQYAVMNAMTKAKFRAKNKLTFVPQKLTMMYSSEKYSVIVKFWAANAYGVKDELTAYYTVDKDGNVTSEC